LDKFDKQGHFFFFLIFLDLCILQATVLEEMPVFPERESSILAVLKKKKPGRVPENDIKEHKHPVAITSTNHTQEEHTPAKTVSSSTASADLLGLSTPPASQPAGHGNTGVLVDMLGELYNSSGSPQPHANNIGQNTYNPNKYVNPKIKKLKLL
jgi:hypothetical protein